MSRAVKEGYQDLIVGIKKFQYDLTRETSEVDKQGSNSNWLGTLTEPGGRTKPYRLAIQAIGEGGAFKETVADNIGVSDHWTYDIEGQTSGTALEFILTKNTRGNFTDVRVQGFV